MAVSACTTACLYETPFLKALGCDEKENFFEKSAAAALVDEFGVLICARYSESCPGRKCACISVSWATLTARVRVCLCVCLFVCVFVCVWLKLNSLPRLTVFQEIR